MSETIFTITNPLKFMNENFFRERLISLGFPEEAVSVNIIKEEQMTKEVELHFLLPEIGNKFYNKYKSKSIGFSQNYKIDIQKGKSDKQTIISKTNEIIYEDRYDKWIDTHYFCEKNDEGLILVNPEQKEIQKKIIGHLISKISSSFIKGQNVLKFLYPIITYDKRTLLQVIAYEFRETPNLLNKIFHISDPIEKLKLMTSFYISQIYLSPLRINIFKPLLGETYQVKIANLNCYFEETNIDPPTTNIYCFDSDGLYKIYGYISIYTRTGPNNCKILKLGNIYAEYKNGQKYKIYYPSYYIGGITIGKRSFNVRNSSLVIDESNRLVSFIQFYNKNGKNKYPDEFEGRLISINEIKTDEKGAKHYIEEEDSIPLAEFKGRWTRELKFGDKIYWKRDKSNLYKLYEPEYKLKSDSSLREDLILYNENNIEKAEIKLIELEERQYNDFKLREKFKKG